MAMLNNQRVDYIVSPFWPMLGYTSLQDLEASGCSGNALLGASYLSCNQEIAVQVGEVQGIVKGKSPNPRPAVTPWLNKPASYDQELRDWEPSIQILERAALQAFPGSKEDTSTGDAFAGQRKLLKHVVIKLRLWICFICLEPTLKTSNIWNWSSYLRRRLQSTCVVRIVSLNACKKSRAPPCSRVQGYRLHFGLLFVDRTHARVQNMIVPRI